MKLTKEQIGYIAGLIDGEGSICLHKCVWKYRNGSFYRPFIKISNSNLEMLIWIKEKLGCGSIKQERPDTGKWKAMYTLTFSANMIRQFLPLIIDCLIIKKRQALLLLEFLKMSKRGLPRYFKQNNQEKYDYFYFTIKKFNSRGVIEKGGEFGGTPTLNLRQEDNTEPSGDLFSGVCNDYGLPPKGMI